MHTAAPRPTHSRAAQASVLSRSPWLLATYASVSSAMGAPLPILCLQLPPPYTHTQMLRRDPAKRLPLLQVATHPWIAAHVKRTAAVLTVAKTMPPAGAATTDAVAPKDVL